MPATPRPRDVRQGVCGVRVVRAGHQPQGLAVPHPHQHVHQQLPQEPAEPYQGAIDELEDWQLGSAESLTQGRAARSAEAEAIDHLPDSDVKAALQAIPEDFRLAVYLTRRRGFSYQEVADIIMKTPVGTVMSRLHRGRRLLRGLLADYARERGIAVPDTTTATREHAMTDCGCDKAKAELEEYLHRELNEQDFQDVTDHLDNCEDCTDEHVVGLTSTLKMQKACKETAPEELRAAILAKLDA